MTIDLPNDLHEKAKRIARDSSRSLSETVAELIRRGLENRPAAPMTLSRRTGLPVVSIGRVMTTDDVRALDDDATLPAARSA